MIWIFQHQRTKRRRKSASRPSVARSPAPSRALSSSIHPTNQPSPLFIVTDPHLYPTCRGIPSAFIASTTA